MEFFGVDSGRVIVKIFVGDVGLLGGWVIGCWVGCWEGWIL